MRRTWCRGLITVTVWLLPESPENHSGVEEVGGTVGDSGLGEVTLPS